MTYGARLFLFILAFQFLTANSVPLKFTFIPKIDCHDQNGNGYPDFIAVNSSPSPRTIYHLEITEGGIETLWEYSMPENKNGYFADMILGDFDNDGRQEIIVAAYQDGSQNIFYIFSTDSMGIKGDIPLITGLRYTLYGYMLNIIWADLMFFIWYKHRKIKKKELAQKKRRDKYFKDNE